MPISVVNVLHHDSLARPGAIAATQRRIIRSIVGARDVDGFGVSKVEVDFLPLPKVSLTVTPKDGARPGDARWIPIRRVRVAAMIIKTVRSASLRVRLAIYGSLIIILVAGVLWERPPTHVTIEVGPVGGSFYQIAQQYREILAERGIDLQVRSKRNSLQILPDLANPASGIDIGFEAQDASAHANAGIYSIGEVQLHQAVQGLASECHWHCCGSGCRVRDVWFGRACG